LTNKKLGEIVDEIKVEKAVAKRPRKAKPIEVKDTTPYVVGIGASAGGLEALSIFLKHLPKDLNCAYIIAQHLSPTYKSMMVALLARETTLPVVEAVDGMVVEKGIVYVTPPDKDIFLTPKGLIRLQVAQSGIMPKPSIDLFFESLSKIKKDKVIGIILSGTGSDGSHGIRSVKAEGGITIAQEPSSAKYDGMPLSAINTGNIDLIVVPEDIGNELEEILKYPSLVRFGQQKEADFDYKDKILGHLLKEKNVDFAQYKQTTIIRRIERRMSALKMANLSDYSSYLVREKDEVDNLYKDILIGVTSFFRDADAFEALSNHVRALIDGKQKGENIRIWVAGCSTGEEAYGIAIIVSDILGPRIADYSIQIFATDLDEEAMAHARKGQYPEIALMSIKKFFIKKYFIKRGGNYEVIKPLREMVIFSVHDIAKDPPFLRLDLISCRNLLIYFNQNLQQRVFSTFHYSLTNNGLLFLGKSESVGANGGMFVMVDKSAKIFKSQYTGKAEPFYSRFATSANRYSKVEERSYAKAPDVKEAAKEIITNAVFPYFVILNELDDIVYFHGENNPYINISKSGAATFSIFKILDQNLNLAARAVIHATKKSGEKSFSKVIRLTKNNETSFTQLVAYQYKDSDNNIFVLLGFLELSLGNLEIFLSPSSDDGTKYKELEYELAGMKEHLQTVIEELETSNEELQSTNEELQSTNEELQSSNEELETTNEELQSTNEELQVAYNEMKVISEEREHQKNLLEEKTNELDKYGQELERQVEREVAIRLDKEAFASAIFDSVKSCICISDTDGVIIEVNEYYLQLFGYSRDEIVGLECWSLVQAEYRERARKLHKDYMNGLVENVDEEWEMVNKDGLPLNVLATFSHTELNGKRLKITSIVDLTQTRRLEVEKSAQELLLIKQSRMAAMGEMIGNIAHQWRQPLNVVAITVQDLRPAYENNEVDKKYVDTLVQKTMTQIKYMSKTIDDFRNFFKHGDEKPFSLKECIRIATELASMNFQNLEIETKMLADSDYEVFGNANQMAQVIITIISNAKDAILERRTKDKAFKDGRIVFDWGMSNGKTMIKISDNGGNVESEILNKIFDPYFTTKHPSVGTGVGLYMAKTIIEHNMHGAITAKNLENGWFEILILLPTAEAPNSNIQQ
jgi:two-component system, chemotaxis family, CheB/CheR fusion protein